MSLPYTSVPGLGWWEPLRQREGVRLDSEEHVNGGNQILALWEGCPSSLRIAYNGKGLRSTYRENGGHRLNNAAEMF